MALSEQPSKEQVPKKLSLLIAESLRLTSEKQHGLGHLPLQEQLK